MLHTRKGREHHLQKQVSQKEKGQQPVLRQALPILGLPGVVLSYSQFHYFIMYTHLTNTYFFAFYTRFGIGSNDPLPLQVLQPVPLLQDTGCPEATEHTVQTPRKKCAIKKKLTPKRAPAVVAASPSSPASNTRSKKQLQLE